MRTTRRTAVATSGALVAVSAMLLTSCGTKTTAVAAGTAAPNQATTDSATSLGNGVRCTAAPPAKTSTPTLQLPDKKSAAGKTFIATIDTNCGTVTVQLSGDKAPQTVASFAALSKKFYAKTPCHRLTTAGIYVLQCGDPTGRGDGGPGYTYGIENPPADGNYPAGSLAMARTSDPNSNGSQFFIVYKDSQIDPSTGGYSIFGRVTSGLPMLQALAAEGTDDSNGPGDGHPKQPIGILKITVTEKKA